MAQTKVTDDVREVTEVDAAKITTGTIPEARITTLDATKLTGTVNNARISLDAAEIPNLAGSKITSGTVDVARLPSTVLNSNVDTSATLYRHSFRPKYKRYFEKLGLFIDWQIFYKPRFDDASKYLLKNIMMKCLFLILVQN